MREWRWQWKPSVVRGGRGCSNCCPTVDGWSAMPGPGTNPCGSTPRRWSASTSPFADSLSVTSTTAARWCLSFVRRHRWWPRALSLSPWRACTPLRISRTRCSISSGAARSSCRWRNTARLPGDSVRPAGLSSFSRQGPEFLERLGGLAAGLGVKNQQMLPAGMGHIEAASVEVELANLRVTHVDDAGAVADIRARPQLAEALAGSRQLVDQRPQPRISHIATDDVS